MKFGKRIRSLATKEWEQGYINYKDLKRCIKHLVHRQNEEQRLKIQKDFDNQIQSEIKKVDAFFLVLVEEIRNSLLQPLQVQKLPDLKCLRTLLFDLVYLSIQVDALRRFAVLNFLAIVKISKKFLKAMKKLDGASDTLESHLSLFMTQHSFYKSDLLDQLYSETAALTDLIMLQVQELEESNSQVRRPDEKQKICPICLYTLTCPVTLSCNHTFCWSCLLTASTYDLHACPLCRKHQSIDPRDYEIDGLVKRFRECYGDWENLNDETHTITAILVEIFAFIDQHLQCIQRKHALATFGPQLPASAINARRENLVKGSDLYGNSKKVLVIAHRGASGTKKANTIESFKEAIKLGSDMIELDVQLCLTGEVVVYHDNVIEFEGDCIFIRDIPFHELRRNSPFIPTIMEVLECIDKRIQVYFDLKSNDVVAPLMGILQRCIENNDGWEISNFLIASFNHYQVLAINDYRHSDSVLKDIETVAITSSIPLGYAKNYEQLGSQYISVDCTIVTEEFILDAHKRGMKVLVWTANYKRVISRMVDMGVDGIISNFPDRVFSVLSNTKVIQPALVPAGAKNVNLSLDLRTGDQVEIVSLFDENKWYPGVVVKCNDNNTYSILWWVSDNSQRRASNVHSHQLRCVNSSSSKLMSPLVDAAAGVVRFAVSWTAYPLLQKFRSFSQSSIDR